MSYAALIMREAKQGIEWANRAKNLEGTAEEIAADTGKNKHQSAVPFYALPGFFRSEAKVGNHRDHRNSQHQGGTGTDADDPGGQGCARGDASPGTEQREGPKAEERKLAAV